MKNILISKMCIYVYNELKMIKCFAEACSRVLLRLKH